MSQMSHWTAKDIPDQRGRLAVVTGANSGLGLVTATELARHGAKVVLAVRNTDSGEQAAASIRAVAPVAELEVRKLDLASLASVREFAEKLTADVGGIDLLVNNAGLVILDSRRETSDGFELHMGTNMLGHFALTGHLLGALDRGDAPRVVNLSSIVHKSVTVDLDDLMSDRDFDGSRAYRRSKLATTAFGLELDRRLRAAGSPVIGVVAHPGMTRTNLTPRAFEHRGAVARAVARVAAVLTTQSVDQGTLPQLYAATAQGVRGGQFFGPAARGERRGHVAEVRPSEQAGDPAFGSRLWTAAEALTGVSYL
ncbi:SDR family NAD(P)-dependent oxidoreductase [Pseudonocardia ailaonensis]|uniref:SDR family NAD(P)-dependent oxidoreductase n=1 Tax=Pseudonocardia ailaonensis TaxID=367279 RepID=A0ABN2NBL8_9PSEU